MSSGPKRFHHGTRADLKPGDLIAASYSSNYGARKQASWVYLTGTLDAAIWGVELAAGEARRANQPGDRISKSLMSPTRLRAESVRSRVLSWKIQLQKRSGSSTRRIAIRRQLKTPRNS